MRRVTQDFSDQPKTLRVPGCGVIIAVAAAVLFFSTLFLDFFVDWLWFDSVGQLSVLKTQAATRLVLFVLAGGMTFLILLANLLIARTSSPVAPDLVLDMTTRVRISDWARRSVWRITIVAAGVVSVVAGLQAQRNWLEFQQFLRATPFGRNDPLFGKDLGFYVFKLPVWKLMTAFAVFWVVAAAIGVAATHLTSKLADLIAGRPRLNTAMVRQLGILAALLLVLISVSAYLGRYDLLYSARGVALGATYTDAHARLWGQWAIVIASLAGAGFVLAGVLPSRQKPWVIPIAFAGIIGVAVVGRGLVPAVQQALVAKPSESKLELPYIKNHIHLTRFGYDLERVKVQLYPASETLQKSLLRMNQDTISNVRMWDYEVLQQVYSQRQLIRTYYSFRDADVDRYWLNGRYQQVLLAAREIDTQQLPKREQTWVNRHLQYTHGYGIVASPANGVTDEGLPEYLVSDIPLEGVRELKLNRPQLYFEEGSADYVIVRTQQKELDYRVSEKPAYTRYEGKAGIALNSFSRRAMFAAYFGESSFIFSSLLGSNAKLLMRRKVGETLEALAPFLTLDADPYPVVTGGRLVWIQDAYTTTERLPYSERFLNVYRRGSQDVPRDRHVPFASGVNYIRNSVKIVMDAYDGIPEFYVIDSSDPVLQSLARIFPTLFKKGPLPAELSAHKRYPEDLFFAQSLALARYHITDPADFYSAEDFWSIPSETRDDGEYLMRNYYLTMRLPGGNRSEFCIVTPFAPLRRNTLVSWFAARCDGDNYGKLVLYEFPKTRNIDGPKQIEGRINADAAISKELTLWNQRGSRVIRSSLIIIPIEGSLLYVQPLYLQAEGVQQPELKRVIAVVGSHLAMGETLREALEMLYSGAEATQPSRRSAPELANAKAESSLVSRLVLHWEAAKSAQKAGDWAEYGRRLEAIDDLIARLKQGNSSGQ